MCEKYCRLRTFCFCCTTRRGSIIIGIIGLIVGLIIPPTILHESHAKVISQERAIYYAIVCVVSLVTSIMLLVGIFGDDRRLIVPWIIFQIVSTISEVIYECFKLDTTLSTFWMRLLIFIAVTLFYIYSAAVVYSYYVQVGTEPKE